jgi:hypothetical protein
MHYYSGTEHAVEESIRKDGELAAHALAAGGSRTPFET